MRCVKKRSLILLLSLVVLSGSVFAQSESNYAGMKPFISDKCSWFPDGNYGDCCVAHDKEYWLGGTSSERKAADLRLKQCVRERNGGWKGKLLSKAMYLGVRIGGAHWLPLPFRWGFGNNWPRKAPEKPKIMEEKRPTVQ